MLSDFSNRGAALLRHYRVLILVLMEYALWQMDHLDYLDDDRES